MVNIFIFHGAFGNPDENWFPWLKVKLEEQNHKVIIPTFPTPENQNLESWLKVFDKYKDQVKEDSIFVGHSLGCPFILNILENYNINIKHSFHVAAFFGLLGNQKFDRINVTISDVDFDFDIIKKHCKGFTCYAANNDPFVPLDTQREFAANLGAEQKMVFGAGHFNSASGYDKFNLLYYDIIDKTNQD